MDSYNVLVRGKKQFTHTTTTYEYDNNNQRFDDLVEDQGTAGCSPRYAYVFMFIII